MRPVRIGVIVLVLLSVSAATGVAAASGPTKPPSFGVMDPLDHNPTTVAPGGFTGSCPWPNPVDAFLPEVQKCLPAAIAWAEDGVRIVSDPLQATETGSGSGAFTFWCQSRVGLHFMVTVQGLAPNTSYAVHATDMHGPGTSELGTIHTDATGSGGITGIVRLAPGGYEWAIHVGTALETVPGDEIGFEVL